MSKYSKLYCIALIIPVTFLLLSFANKPTSQTPLAGSKTTIRSSICYELNSNPAATVNVSNIVDKLPFFIGERDDFINLTPATKLIFSHSLDALGPVRLSAWLLDENDNFEDGKRIDLVPGGPSRTDSKAGLYFGNVVLKPGQLGKIRKELRNNKDADYVIFTPVIIEDHFIGYRIGISENKAVGVNFVEFAEANPSPPKVY